MLTPLSNFRPITAPAGAPGGTLFDLLPPAQAGQAQGAALAKDSFQLGGRGFVGSPGGLNAGAGTQQISTADVAQLVELLRAIIAQGAGQTGAPAQAGAQAALPAMPAAAPLGAAMPGACRELGTLGGAQWGNVAPLMGSALSGLNGQVAAPAPNALAGQALEWSAAQMNPATATAVNPNTGVSQSQDPNAWSNWCLAFVSGAYGYQVPELRAATAFDSYKNFAGQGRIQQDRNPPAGAPVFFNQTQGTPWGHVGIATGKSTADGDPIIRTTGSPDKPGIFEVPLSQLEQMTAGYLGWARL